MAKQWEYTALLEQAVDVASAAISAAWPRSTEAEEMRRLRRAGYTTSTVCDVDFSLSFEGPATAGIALDLIGAAGFLATDQTLIERGFVVVRVPLRLSAYDLALTTHRLDRMVGPLGGFAAFIGPVTSAPSMIGRAAELDSLDDEDSYRVA